MKHNIKIPGWNGIQILDILGKYASEVPENGNILELGALFGRSTYTLGHNKKDSVRLLTIDCWPTILFKNHALISWHDGTSLGEEYNLMMSKAGPEGIDGKDFYGLWKEYTKGIVNNISIRAYTSISNKNESVFPLFDFIYHDASHEESTVYKDLVHWFPKLKQDGVLIIDDYEINQFSGLCKAVDRFIDENNLDAELVTHRNLLIKRKV